MGMRRFGQEGRTKVFGTALFFSVINLVLVIYSAMGLSSDASVLDNTYWGLGRGYNDTIGENHDDGFVSGNPVVEVHIGITYLTVWDIAGATESSIIWKRACDSNDGSSDLTALTLAGLCGKCEYNQYTHRVTAPVLIVSSLIQIRFNLLRLFCAWDMPYIKVSAVISGVLFSFFSAYAFVFFYKKCNQDMPGVIGPITASWNIGPGVWTILATFILSLANLLLHWVTPVPEERRRPSWIIQDNKRKPLLGDPGNELVNRLSFSALTDYEYSPLDD